MHVPAGCKKLCVWLPVLSLSRRSLSAVDASKKTVCSALLVHPLSKVRALSSLSLWKSNTNHHHHHSHHGMVPINTHKKKQKKEQNQNCVVARGSVSRARAAPPKKCARALRSAPPPPSRCAATKKTRQKRVVAQAGARAAHYSERPARTGTRKKEEVEKGRGFFCEWGG